MYRMALGFRPQAVDGTKTTAPSSQAALDVAMGQLVGPGPGPVTLAASSSREIAGGLLAGLPTAWDPVVPPWTAGCRATAVDGGTRSAPSLSTVMGHRFPGAASACAIHAYRECTIDVHATGCGIRLLPVPQPGSTWSLQVV